ncbi:MAG: DMT family transporter [Pseudomonadota bacterium]
MSSAILLPALAMIASAMLHSVMGLLTKQAGDKLMFRALMQIVAAVLMLPVIVMNPLPEWEVWRFLMMGAVIHFTFQMTMIAAFERGDMSLVYPVMRGSAPALAGIAALFFLGEPLSPADGIGLAIVSAAVIAFGWPEKGGAPKAAALAFALIAGAMTALYSVNDASGARAAGNAIYYLAWFLVLNAVPINLVALARRKGRWISVARRQMRVAVIAAVLGAGSYAFALYALSEAAVAPMAALRETSVVFGAILAALVLKEPFGARRIILAICLAFGLVLLQAG